jgi:hypothetical protein
MYAIFSCINELPPKLRYLVENIVVHSFISGAQFDFNNYLKYNKEIDTLLDKGIILNNSKTITLSINGLIADAPARCKALNSKCFMGSFGCIKCYHPTTRNDENNKQIYTYDPTVPLRTSASYQASHHYIIRLLPRTARTWLS